MPLLLASGLGPYEVVYITNNAPAISSPPASTHRATAHWGKVTSASQLERGDAPLARERLDAHGAGGVLAVARDRGGLEARGESWSDKDRADYEDMIRQQYETQGHPFYASARLWDDGVIDPVDTRRVLGQAISASMNRPRDGESPYGIFRM